MCKIFITVEAQSYVAHTILQYVHNIEKKLTKINLLNYTDLLTNVTIVINCFEDSWIKQGFGKERKYISYKNQYADVRLKIPYNIFIDANEDAQYSMVVENIIASIKTINDIVNKRTPNSFKGEMLIADIKKLIHNST